MVKLLRSEYSEQAQLFVEYIKSLMNHSLKRICTTPEESRAKELHYRNLWRDNEKSKADLERTTKDFMHPTDNIYVMNHIKLWNHSVYH